MQMLRNSTLCLPAKPSAFGHSLDGASVIACLAGDIRPAMVAALDRLKAEGFGKLGCITNNVPGAQGRGHGDDSEDKAAVPWQAIMARFDHVIESSKGRHPQARPAHLH